MFRPSAQTRSGLALFSVGFWLWHLLTFRRFGILIADSGKELVVPWLLQDGAKLYRDVFWLYGPFPPQFNALLYGVFGVHLDVLWWLGHLLSFATCLAAYAVIQPLRGSRTALLGAIAIAAFSTTSNYFVWPYSFANLWATVLGLTTVALLVRIPGKSLAQRRNWLLAAGALAGWVSLCKYIIVFPLLVAVLGLLLAERRSDQEHRSSIAVLREFAFFAVPALGLFLGVNAWYAADIGWRELSFQAFGGFHAIHLTNRTLYDRLREAVFLQNGLGTANVSAALAILISIACPLLAAICWWRSRRANEQSSEWVPATAIMLFALGNVLQTNSSVHAPYVFPAGLTGLLCVVPMDSKTNREVRSWRPVTCGVLAFSCLLAMGRLPGALWQTELTELPDFRVPDRMDRAKAITNAARFLHDHTGDQDRLIVFCWQDYLYLTAKRKPALGYLYTWYPAFHDPAVKERLLRELREGPTTALVTRSDEPFVLSFDSPKERREIEAVMREYFAPLSRYNEWGELIIWLRKPQRERTASSSTVR